MRQFTKLDRGRMPCELRLAAPGDEIELSYEPCPCGRTTLHIAPEIERYSEKQGDDRITCAATQKLQHEDTDFLKGIEP